MTNFFHVLSFIPNTDFAIMSAMLGLFLGSFYNVCADRTLAGQSILWPPSHCEACGTTLKPWELIPVVSWLCLRGRCAHCGAKVSIQYPLAEIVSTVLAGVVGWVYGPSLAWLGAMVFTGLFFVMSVIDIKAYILPDGLTLGGAVLALPASIFLFGHDWLNALLGGLIGAGVFWLVGILYLKRRGIEGLGFGDVKLMLSIGFLVTAELLSISVILAGLTALVAYGVIALLGRNADALAEHRLPFGPFLCFAGWLTLLFGDVMWQRWLGFVLG